MARLQRVGREMRMLVENTEDQTPADPGLLRIVARAHDIQARLTQNTDLIRACYRQSGTSIRRLTSIACCVFPRLHQTSSPPLSMARIRLQLTAKKLMRLALQIPIDWTEQRKLLGFQ